MPLFTDLPSRETSLDELPTSLWQTMLATGGAALEDSPVLSIDRMIELRDAMVGRDIPGYIAREDELPPTVGPSSPVLPREEAQKRVREEGVNLNVDADIPEAALDILVERAKERRRRDDVLARGPQGFIPGSARLAAALGASLLDPVNVASAFVPAVGPTRYAAMVARAGSAFGRAGVRAGVGAVEGAAGAALVAPLVYGAKSQEQADFDAWDVMFDIALGGALGGGLHVVGGGALDIVRARRGISEGRQSGVSRLLDEAQPETREAALRTSVAQMAEGKPVEVEALVRLDPAVREGDAVRQTETPEARVNVEQPRLPETPPFEPVGPRVRSTATPSEIVSRVQEAPRTAGVAAPESLVQDVATVMRREIAKTRPAQTRKPTSLVRFLANEGGLKYSPELKKLGLEKVFVPGAGRLVRKEGGRSLDYAREVAAQHGYMHRFGTPDEASAQTTISDLLDLLDEDHRSGGNVIRTDDFDFAQAQAARDVYDEQVRALDDALSEIDDALTNDLPLEIKRRAVELRLEDGLEPFDALERAIMEDHYSNGAPEPVVRDDGQEIEVPFDDPTFAAGDAGQRAAVPGTGPGTQGRGPGNLEANRQAFGRARGADRESFQEVQGVARAEQPSAIADGKASRAADETLASPPDPDNIEALRSETDDILSEVEETADALDLRDEFTAEVQAADLSEDAETYGRAVKALASCQLRRG